MKNKKVQLVFILIGLLIFTVLFSLLSNQVRNSSFNDEETTKNHETTIAKETTVEESLTKVIEEFETAKDNKIAKITPELTKTVKDFSEIENKVYEVVNSYYPDTKTIEFSEFKQEKDKYSYTFNLKGDLDHEVIIYYWLKDKSLSYQHY